jgi:GMP synthase-like glutamine amidotransferase
MPAMRIAILQNNTDDGPAYLATWLRQRNIAFDVFDFERGDEAPASLADYAGLAILGGVMSVNDDLPSLRQAEVLIREARTAGKPVIGHCLGGQLIAKALGATVGASPNIEIGWWPMQTTDSAAARAWFGEFAGSTPTVIQWHYESFAVPAAAELIGSSDACPQQAFAIDTLLAMQFHVEIDAAKHALWLSASQRELARLPGEPYVQTASVMAAQMANRLTESQKLADAIYSHFETLAKAASGS